MRRLPALLAAGVTVLLTACGGGGDSPPAPVTPPPTPTIAIALAPAAITASRGATTTTTVTLTRGGNYAGMVTLAAEGVPNGVQVTFSPASLTTSVTSATVAIAVGATAAVGTSSFTITGTGAGVATTSIPFALTVATPPGVTVSAITAQQLSQGTSSATAIPLVLTRTGGLAGDLTLALEGAPTGITATFTPNPVAGTGAQMTLNAAATTAPGSYALAVRATGAGGASGTSPFTLTITAAEAGSVSINTVPATLSVVQGQTALTTVNIARAGGFTGAVTLSASGLPAGTTATFTPEVAAGTQAQLGLVVGAATPAGSYPVTVRAQGAGVREATTTLTLTVTPASSGGNTVNWTFCAPERFPVWFAYQTGTSGAWTALTPTGSSTRAYAVPASTVGAVAYAIPRAGGGADVFVSYLTAAELGFQASNECVGSRRTKSLTGTVTNVPAGALSFVSVGGSGTLIASPATTFTLSGVADGLTDLVAFRSAPSVGNVGVQADRGILRRNVDYTAGSSIPTLDFNGNESFAVATANVSVLNAGGDQVSLATLLLTTNGVAGPLTTATQPVAIATQRVFGVPRAQLLNGDQHQIQAVAVNSAGPTTSTRSVTLFNRELSDRTVALGAVLPTFVPAIAATAPYRRLSLSGLWQADYGDVMAVQYLQQPNTWTVSVSRGYAGGSANWTLAMPDLSGVAGFNTAWGLGSGSIGYTVIGSGGTQGGLSGGGGTFAEGASFRQALRTGTLPP